VTGVSNDFPSSLPQCVITFEEKFHCPDQHNANLVTIDNKGSSGPNNIDGGKLSPGVFGSLLPSIGYF
jgi:hypothetical protein